jgi:Gluconate 2-dehydrogenase subunit 3
MLRPTNILGTTSLNRRYFLAGSLLLASGLFEQSSAAERAALKSDGTTNVHAPVLNEAQNELLKALCDTILPTTATPGATDARVDEFIQLILGQWCTPQERQTFIAGLEALGRDTRAKGGRSFPSMPTAQRLAYLEPLDREAVAARARGEKPLPFFATLKELTLIGYYTSEVGCNAIGYPGPVGTGPGRDGPIDSDIWV